MTAELFSRFVPLFIEAGRNINTSLQDGSTFLDLVSEHRKSAEYANILAAVGGTKK
jgi:hypothetical protein